MKINKYPYIVAEIGCNHNGDIELAKRMIKKAKECGCNAIKLQLWKGEDLITKKHLLELNDGKVKLENVSEWKTKELGLKNIFEQINKFAIYKNEHIKLFEYARRLGIDYASTAIKKDDIDFLLDQKVSFLKVASMDINNLDFLEYVISKNYPTFISTGLASLSEIESVVNIIPKKYKKNITLLHCISIYPPKDNIVNLRLIKSLKRIFDIKIGYSDHTLGFSIPLAAVSLGASVIEKHFTLDKNMPGWDHKISANPEEMEIICKESKRIIDALGNGRKILTKEEKDKKLKFRRSLTTTKYLKRGHIIRRNDITLKRPGTGIQPEELKYVIGRKLKHNIEEDRTLFWKDIN